jgi:hypothetical protein
MTTAAPNTAGRMAPIAVRREDRVTMTINHADSQLVVFVNDGEVYNERTALDRRPTIDTLQLAARFQVGDNFVNVCGINRGGPSHFDFTIDKNENRLPGADVNVSPPGGGLVRSWGYHFLMR